MSPKPKIPSFKSPSSFPDLVLEELHPYKELIQEVQSTPCILNETIREEVHQYSFPSFRSYMPLHDYQTTQAIDPQEHKVQLQ